MTDTDDPLHPLRDEIKAEYMRGLPDAYAGSATIRELTFARLMERIERYTGAMLAAAIMSPNGTDQAPTMANDAPAKPATQPRRNTRTAPRRARP
jgi:hypothetical protein